MRRLGITVTALCALAAATPARAFGDLQNCDAIKDAGERMTCLYAHIAHLEQTLLASARTSPTSDARSKRSLTRTACTSCNMSGREPASVMPTTTSRRCFRVATAPIRGSSPADRSRLKAPSTGHRRRASPTRRKARARVRKSPRTRRRMNPKPMLSLRSRLSLSPYPKPQPSLNPRLSLRRTRSIQARGSSRGPACPR